MHLKIISTKNNLIAIMENIFHNTIKFRKYFPLKSPGFLRGSHTHYAFYKKCNSYTYEFIEDIFTNFSALVIEMPQRFGEVVSYVFPQVGQI